jgi:UPF0755 protein
MYVFSYYTGINKPVNLNGETVEFSIETGDSVEKISKNLEKLGLINSARHFKTYVWLRDYSVKLQAGTFAVSPAMPVKEIVKVLVTGESVNKEKEVTIIEGWKLADIEKYIEKNSVLNETNYKKRVLNPLNEWNFAFDKPDFLTNAPQTANLEGYLFPDTYKIFADASADDLIEKQLDNFGLKLNGDLRTEIQKQGKSIHEIVTMASIIEKEVSSEKDMAIVSGILNKRIAIGMRLEVDSTINYLTGKDVPAAELSDLEIDSPYNTYKNYGLPPGPICNPGLAAIKAAIYPEASEYLFYLNRQDTKETIFGKNYDEHLKNKAKYLK